MKNKLDDLIQAALDKTEVGGLKWSAFDSNMFRVTIGSGHLHIQRGSERVSYDGDETYPATTYSVQITDAQGRVVAEEDVMEGDSGFTLFDQLFQAARRSALGSDRVIEDMLQSLRGGVRP